MDDVATLAAHFPDAPAFGVVMATADGMRPART
jgi:hypothetical protein